jgi:flagellar hook-associated protein 1 FlgK
MSSLLSIGRSGLLAAQAGLATTGHNITNSNVLGYNRQVVVQGTTPPLQTGDGFIGTGTEVAQIKRVYDDFLNRQLLGAQTNQAQLDTYFNQVSQIDNLLADTTVGLAPALQGFFSGVQNANSNPQSTAARQAMLSAAESLASRFNGQRQRNQFVRAPYRRNEQYDCRPVGRPVGPAERPDGPARRPDRRDEQADQGHRDAG